MASFYSTSSGLPSSSNNNNNNNNNTDPNAAYYGHNQQQQQPSAQQQQNNYYGGYPSGESSSSANDAPVRQQPSYPPSIPTPAPVAPVVASNIWNPAATVVAAAASGNMSNEAMLDIAGSAWKYSMAHGTAQASPFIDRIMGSLRVYFAVDNHFVKKKIQRVLFPFLFKAWKRLEIESPPQPPNAPIPPTQYALPIHDENAPDLYLPFMSLITYVLLCGLLYGTSGKFTPEVLPDVTTKCFVTQVIEVVLIRFGIYMMQVPLPMLDLFSLTGYKYLGLCINMLVGIGFGRKFYYGMLFYTAACISFYVLKVLANEIPRVTASTGPKREFLVLGCGLSQFATMWFLSQTKNLQA